MEIPGIVLCFLILIALVIAKVILIKKYGAKAVAWIVFGWLGAGLLVFLLAGLNLIFGVYTWFLIPAMITVAGIIYTLGKKGKIWISYRVLAALVLLISVGSACYLGNTHLPILWPIFKLGIMVCIGYIVILFGVGGFARGIQLLTGQRRV